MTRLLIAVAFVFGLAIGVSLCKRKPPPVSPCPETEDRLDFAGLNDRASRYDRDFDAKKRLERK